MNAPVRLAHKAPTSAARDLGKYLSVSLSGERFGIPVTQVREILEYSELTPVPMLPSCVRGAINLRGKGVPVIDLAVRFGRGEAAIGRRTCIVICEAPPMHGERFDVGLLVDAVNEVVDIAHDAIEPAPSFGGQLRTDFFEGMGRINDRFIVLLNVRSILTLSEQSLGSALIQARAAT